MKASKDQWLAMVLLVCGNVAARAQQVDQASPPNLQELQQGQQQIQPSQQPANDQSNARLSLDRYVVNQVQYPSFNSNAPANHDWLFTGTGGVAWTGVLDPNADMSLTPADDALRAHLSLPKDQGLIVTSLRANAPAAQAGIQRNDVLLALGDASLAKVDDLEEGLKAAGEKPISLLILRAGKRLKIKVQPRVRVIMGAVQHEVPAFWIGVTVSPLEPALRAQLKLSQSDGLLAIDVIKDSPAAQADIKLHDILLSLDGKPLDSQEKLVELVQSNGEKSVRLEVIREGKTQTILVTPQRRKPSQHQAASERLYYSLVRPGAVLNVDPNYQLFNNGAALRVDPNGGWIADVTQTESKAGTNTPASTKRLDDLDAEIKQLRKAIEELNKILKDKK